MRKVNIGWDCACGCGRKTEVGQYAYWHVKNPIPELRKPCECGCGQLTDGRISCITREPPRYILYHGKKGKKCAGYHFYRKFDHYCKCGCGRKAMDGAEYANSHYYTPVPELVQPCACGCGELTSGKVNFKTGEPYHYRPGHAKRVRNKKTDIEVLVESVLIELGIEYIYDERLGYYYPDFQLPRLSVILECDGEYWHSFFNNIWRDKRKDSYYKNRGWKVIRLLEKDIKRDAHATVTQALGIPNS